MADARRRAVGLVLVYRFDRFARGVRQFVTALDEFQALGIEFVSYSESLDTSTPIAGAMLSIIAALAEIGHDIIAERSIEGQRRARARGKHVGRPRRAVDRDRIFRLRADRLSVRKIARVIGASRTVVTRVVRKHEAA